MCFSSSELKVVYRRLPLWENIVKMSSDAANTSSDDSCTTKDIVQLVEITFSQGVLSRPWKWADLGQELTEGEQLQHWLQMKVLKKSVETANAEVWKIRFHSGCMSMVVYFENLSNEAMTSFLIPELRVLLSPNGKVRLLTSQEAIEALMNDLRYESNMQAQIKTVGDFGRA